MDLEGFLKGNSTLRRVVTGFQTVAPEARRALYEEILPQLGEIPDLDSLNRHVGEISVAITETTAKKDALYIRLIRYKAIDQSDNSFFHDVRECLAQWALEKTNAGFTTEPEPEPEDPESNLREDLQKTLKQGVYEDIWSLSKALNEVLISHGVPQSRARARPDGRDFVTIDFNRGEGSQTLSYHKVLGWRDRSGLRSSQQSAEELVSQLSRHSSWE